MPVLVRHAEQGERRLDGQLDRDLAEEVTPAVVGHRVEDRRRPGPQLHLHPGERPRRHRRGEQLADPLVPRVVGMFSRTPAANPYGSPG